MEHGRRIEDRAARFAEAALAQEVETKPEQARILARYMVAFHEFELRREGTPDSPLEHALRRIEDPAQALPRVVEKVGQGFQLLKNEAPGPETSYLARTMLEDALKLLGRSDLTV